MKDGNRQIKRRLAIGVAICVALAIAFIVSRPASVIRALPRTSLSFLGVSNLPPIGIVTAFSISNGSSHRLLYDPKIVEHRLGNQWISIPLNSIVNRVGICTPGQTYVFFLPGSITNHSIRIQIIGREQGTADGLLAKLEGLVRKVSDGQTEALLGPRYNALLTEANR